MSVNIVTGMTGVAHITSDDDRIRNASYVGNGKFVLPYLNEFEAEIINNNLVRIQDGMLMNQGTQMGIEPTDYEDVVIENGLSGVNRNDLIVMRYEKQQDTGLESASLVVIKGTSGDKAVDPEYIEGNILDGGDLIDDMPLYRVKIESLSIVEVEPLFEVKKDIETILEEFTEEISAELDGKMDTTNPTGTGSFSMNRRSNTAIGNYSHAEGYNTTASGAMSHAEGNDTVASGDQSHAEGNGTTASGYRSHAEGSGTVASGGYSHASGVATQAGYYNQFVTGRYNDNKQNNLFEIGNGTSDGNRSNAMAVNENGDLSIGGDIYDGEGNKLDAAALSELPEDMEELRDSLSTTSTATGNPISISDSAHVNAEELKVELEPIQDLHGYDNPWAGGAGKNKLVYPYVNSSQTVSGVTLTIQNDGTVNINGTATATISFVLADKVALDNIGSGDYILNGCAQGGATDGSTYFLGFYAPGKSKYDFGSGTTISLSGSEDASANVYIRINNGFTASNLVFKPMIRLSTETDPTFEPYSNICPISGYDETSVVVKDTADNPTVTDTYTLQFGDTVYGAEVDFVSGVATVTKGYIAEYAGEILPSTWISDRDVYAGGTTPTTGSQVVYELATPTTIQLTPQQIKMLKGNNVLVADGDMNLTYQVDGVVGDIKEWTEEQIEGIEVSANGFEVVVSTSDFVTFSCNHTYSEIVSALQSGEIVNASFLNTLDAVYTNNGSVAIEIQGTDPTICISLPGYITTSGGVITSRYNMVIKIDSNNTIEFFDWTSSGGGGGTSDSPTGFTPVGSIIPYMGNVSPRNYLACDGSVVNISDYPELADFFETQFHTKNYFGGDGITTFAVPDLRGEFLRGTGTNSHENQGSGTSVGTHQNATESNAIGYSTESGVKYTTFSAPSNRWAGYVNADSQLGTQKAGNWISTYGGTTGSLRYDAYTSRPTNTSVLWIIAVKDLYVEARHSYSTSEKIVGEWIDGSTVYEKTVDLGSDTDIGNTAWHDTGVDIVGINMIISVLAVNSSGSFYAINAYHDGNTLKLLSNRYNYNANVRYITIQYTKTTE